MKCRVLVPKILDQLDHDAPDALRSRKDLQRINQLLGNFRWLKKTLAKLGALDGSTPIVELGAGDGLFVKRLVQAYPQIRYTAIDLAPRPIKWPENLGWKQGDALNSLAETGGGILIANLFLRHLTDAQLRQLGCGLSPFQAVICNEPARYRIFHGLGKFLHLIGLNHVTRFDMHASIDAGFRGNELSASLDLRPDDWEVTSTQSVFGILRMVALRR